MSRSAGRSIRRPSATAARSSSSETPSSCRRCSRRSRAARASPSSPSSRPSAAKSTLMREAYGRPAPPHGVGGALRRPGEASDRARRIPPEQMIVLGIDPGTANTGYGVVARRGGRLVALDGGVIQTAPALGPPRRPTPFHARAASLLAQHNLTAAALEGPYLRGKHRRP